MSHCLSFREFFRVFTFIDRRMISGYFFDAVVAELIKACVSDVSDRSLPMIEEGDRQHAGHIVPLRTGVREPVNLIIGDGNRFSNTLGSRTRPALKPRSKCG